jgi:hypothetical protein
MNNSVDGTSQQKEVPVNYIVATETMTAITSTTSTVAVGTDGIPSFAATPSSTTANKDKEKVPMLNAPTTSNTTKEGTEGSTNKLCIMFDMFFFQKWNKMRKLTIWIYH